MLRASLPAFGEVQVMDWGLAKPIAGHEPLARQPLGNARDVNQGIDSISLAGDVMGTPAYIAPEQARGEIDQLDERCDVFGLGGILCAMLIGRPPFIGSVAEMLHQASRGDLTESFAQLDRCGADSDLVVIAKKCLAPNFVNRYRNGAEVADAVTSHREGVQERLAQAEVARARAQVQAGEERRRRRLTLSFSAIVLLMIVAAGGAGFLYQSERQRLKPEQSQREIEDAKRRAELVTTREKVTREVTEALDSAEKSRVAYQRQLSDPIQTAKLLGDLNQWEAILTDGHHAWKRANAVAAGNRPLLNFSLLADVDEMGAMLTADQHQLDVAKKLDEIRLGVAARVDGWFETSRAGPKYTKLFQAELKLDLKQTNPEQSAAKIRESPIRFALVATLDHWALALSGNGDPELLTRLLEVARQADPDPVRNQFRNPKIWQDGKNLQKLAEAIDVASQPPPFLSALAVRLKIAEGDPVPLLCVALVYHPRDFWLNVELGLQQAGPNSDKNGEAAGYLQAALAVRPSSPVVYAALGNVLSLTGGSGNDIILGGSENDVITSFGARDMMIGGTGLDNLNDTQDNAEDILIGDSSPLESDNPVGVGPNFAVLSGNDSTLAGIFANWIALTPFAGRVTALQASGIQATASDGSRDVLQGSQLNQNYFQNFGGSTNATDFVDVA